jgi:ribosomal protein S18 acetylase RimI-like enzyme
MRTLAPEEIPTAARLLARAFDADPLFRWLYPTDAKRAGWVEWFMSATLRQAMHAECVFALDDDQGLAGVANCIAPGRFPLGTMSFVRAGLALPPSLPTWRSLREGVSLDRAVLERHPPVPHWYLYVLGVEPRALGRGHGGALLRHVVGRADEDGVPTHLETANPKNLTLYRKFGFEVVEEIVRGEAPPVWVMTRPAKED